MRAACRSRRSRAANVIGAAIWSIGITLLGYFLGKEIGSENIDKYLLPIVAVIIVLSLIPPFLEWRKHKKRAADARRRPKPRETDRRQLQKGRPGGRPFAYHATQVATVR